MTRLQWKQLEETVAELTPQEKERLTKLLDRSHDLPQNGESTSGPSPLLGLMSDEPGLVDQVVEAAHSAREIHPLRNS